VGDEIQPFEQSLGFHDGQHVRRVDIGRAAGILGQRDTCERKPFRQVVSVLLKGGQELLDGRNAESRSPCQFRHHCKTPVLNTFL
jgi:hypothetical protein